MNKEREKTENYALLSGLLSAILVLVLTWGLAPGTVFWALKKLDWVLYLNLLVFLIAKNMGGDKSDEHQGWSARLWRSVVSFNRAFALFSVAFLIVICSVLFIRG